MSLSLTLIPEWEEQDLVLLTWPHEDTDWSEMLSEVTQCYLDIAKAILKYEDLLVLSQTPDKVKSLFEGYESKHKLYVMEMPSNDTWIRDYGPLSFRIKQEDGKEVRAIADFTFNGWGMKFAAAKDNLMTRCLHLSGAFKRDVQYQNRLMLVLEGGSLESDGRGTILSTYGCLHEPNRNAGFAEEDLQNFLSELLGAERLILLKNGELEGDDTDGHVDTLARFLSPTQIAYVQCTDGYDIHYHGLKRMEEELQNLRTPEGTPYELIPLPLPSAIHEEDGHRLPATYANFLFVNGAILVPTYGQESDEIALERLRVACPDREIVGIDCRQLIRQHGSLHCATMQIPLGFTNKENW